MRMEGGRGRDGLVSGHVFAPSSSSSSAAAADLVLPPPPYHQTGAPWHPGDTCPTKAITFTPTKAHSPHPPFPLLSSFPCSDLCTVLSILLYQPPLFFSGLFSSSFPFFCILLHSAYSSSSFQCFSFLCRFNPFPPLFLLASHSKPGKS